MNKKVLDRPMFKKGEEVDVENVGIMSGFKDLFEGEDDDMEEEDDLYDSSKMLDRKPDSPEILMNNLRGDMRSVDARREELADMVGYEAAMETPDAVLALVQSSLAGGIGGLPMGAQPTAQGPMPMPQGPMPMAGAQPPMPPMPPAGPGAGALPTPPINMARGGIVQRFQEGSDEDGVTPAGTDTSSAINYSPELIARAQSEMNKFISQRPMAVPSLQTAMAEKLPLYKSIMGTGTDDYNQAMALLALGQAGARYATGRDDQGKPITGSGVSRFIQSFSPLGGQFAQLGAQKQKEEQAIKLAALQAGEKEVEAAKAANIKLIENQRKAFADILKAAGKTDSPFGKGLKGSAYNKLVALAPEYAMGRTSEDQDRQFEAAIGIVTEPEFFVDELGNRRTRVPTLPDFAANALKMRGRSVPSPAVPGLTPPPGAPAAAAPGTTPAPGPTAQGTGVTPSATSTIVAPAAGEPTLFNAAQRGTGIVPVTASWLSKFPFLGNIAPGEQQAVTFIENSINQLNRAIATNPRFAEGERQQIQRELDLAPKLLDNPDAFRNRLIGLDDLMVRLRREAAQKSVDPSIAVKDQIEARDKVSEIDKIRSLMGIPPRVASIEDFRQLPAGSQFLIKNSKTGALEVRTKK